LPLLSSERSHVFGIDIDRVTLREAVGRVTAACKVPGPCRYVVTPNLDHSMELQRNPAFRGTYRDAWLVVADGWPVVFASLVFGSPVPERVAGSDLVPAVLAAAGANDPLRVFLLGAGPGVAERAARNVEATCPGVHIVGTYSPPFGFERDAAENARILSLVSSAETELLIVGVGAPKQELWVHAHRHALQARVALCAGATIDFLAGEKPRAPIWMQRFGVEWVHRMTSEPKRLVPRYARNAVGFPWLLYREARARALGAFRDERR
jgi:N-acetylglucosaminyldiphosphoundecaprenol N-acetyl-beta-D-mannosaminyltransferase